jgi:uncharacterized protein (TIGR00255 family)
MSTPSLNAGKRGDAEQSSTEKKLPGRTAPAPAPASVSSPAAAVKSAAPAVNSPAMSIKSMTGYAEAHSDVDGFHLRVSLRSVNHRFLDLRVRLSEGFEACEPAIRQVVRDRLRRGHIDITVFVEPVGAAIVEVQHETAAAYMRAVQELRRDFGLTGEPDVLALLRLPGVIAARGRPAGTASQEEEVTRLGLQVTACVAEALDRLEEMREAEGRSLASEMHSLVAAVGAQTAELESLTTRSQPAYALRLRTKVEELLANLAEARGDLPGNNFQESFVDPSRLAQEAALLAERADVSEELARLRSHTAQFGNLVDGGGEIGKKLDFLLQEMHREANTLLAKTPALGEDALTVTDLGLQIKAAIEKLREQVQNVE